VRVRRRSAFVALFATVLAAPARAQDTGEWERPFVGALPLPDPAVSVNPKERTIALPRRRATYLLDAQTLAPIPGALLRCTAEREDDDTVAYGDLTGEARAGADGLVVLDPGPPTEGFHWVAEAPGYAPSHASPLYRPEPLTFLRRGPDTSVRVLDGLGRPVAGAQVDLFAGGPHGPPVRAGATGADGRFRFGPFRGGTWWFDVRTATGACDQVGTEGTLGRRAWDVVLWPRELVRGRVVDAAGRPVPDVAVISSCWERAPRARTAKDGRFELPGCATNWSLRIVPPGAEEPVGFVRRFGATPFDVRLTADGTGIESPETDASVTVRAAPGLTLSGQRMRLTRDDGWSVEAESEEGGSDTSGVAEIDVPAGRYVVRPATRFGPVTFAEQRFEASRETAAVWEIAGAAPQPRLAVRGSVPKGAEVALAVADDAIGKPDSVESADWRPHLPADGAAAVAVNPAGHWRVWFFFPVGPVKDGVRTVDIDLPRPHVVVVENAGDLPDLFFEGVPVVAERDGNVLTTYASGPMKLRAEDGNDVREMDLDLGSEPAKEPVVVDFSKSRRVAPAIVRVRFAPPSGVAAEGVTSGVPYGADVTPEGKEATEVVATAPCRIVLTLAGHQSFDRTFGAVADVEFRWGTATLKLAVRDAGGAPAPSIVAVDGVRHWTADGDLSLAGLSAGAHDVVVFPAADALEGRAVHLVLAEGETRERTVVVPPRK
jgi:hypothetical protein